MRRWRGTAPALAAVGLTLAEGILPGLAVAQAPSPPSASPPPAQAQQPQARPPQQPPTAPGTAAPSSPQARGAAQGAAAAHLWFDPTQLPTFTGTVESYLPNPRGEIDRLVFREGPQVVFPPDLAEGVRQAAPPGRPITVWGIRARNAPVITMLAYSANPAEMPPVLVDRLHLRPAEPGQLERPTPLAVGGVVKAPYYTPQGEVAGAILDDGSVVILTARAMPPAQPLRDLFRPGARLAAEGVGYAGEAGRALFAERIGGSPETLQPVPANAASEKPAGDAPPAEAAPAAAPQQPQR